MSDPISDQTKTPAATVLVVFGPEWAPVRSTFTQWLDSSQIGDLRSIATLSTDRTTPDGRVSGWIAIAAGATPILPGGTSVSKSDGPWCGVTDLLLDPDPFQVEQLYALGIWTRFIPRRERLKMRVSPTLPDDIAANAGSFNPVLSVLIGEVIGQHLIVASADIIAAEVVARAIRAIAQPAGDTGISAWQAPIVQSAIEQRMGVTNGAQFSVNLVLAGPMAPNVRAELIAIMTRVFHAIDTRMFVL